MKISLISSGFLPVVDGVTVTLWHRLQYLNKLGHKVLLFCPDYSVINNIYPNWQDYTGQVLPHVRVVNLPSSPFFALDFERNVNAKSYEIVLNELQSFKPDIIHVDEPERLWLGFFKRPGLDYAKKENIPCVSFFHTNFIEYMEDFLPLPSFLIKIIQFLMKYHRNWIYNAYDATLISSLSTSQYVAKLGFKNIISSQLLGVDIDKYQMDLRDSNFWERQYNIVGISEKIKLIFVGRLTPEKGWDFTLNSLLNSDLNFQNIAFIIVGEGIMREKIVEKLKQLTPDVYCLGRIPPWDVPNLLINSDIHITTSQKETKGLTVLEAQAAGIPVLAPQSQGIVDSIESQRNGLLFIPNNQQDFLEKLAYLCNNPMIRQKLGQKAREESLGNNWEKVNENLLKIWQEQILNYRERI